jgi:hypothetical protein
VETADHGQGGEAPEFTGYWEMVSGGDGAPDVHRANGHTANGNLTNGAVVDGEIEEDPVRTRPLRFARPVEVESEGSEAPVARPWSDRE